MKKILTIVQLKVHKLTTTETHARKHGSLINGLTLSHVLINLRI